MSDSSSRITIPPKQWVDLYSLAMLPVGTKILIQNTGRDEASLSESEFSPTSLIGHNNLLVNNFLVSSDNPVGAWAYSRLGTKIQIEVDGVNGFTPYSFSDSTAKDYALELAAGNIQGSSGRGWVSTNQEVGVVLVDVWGGTGDLVYPIANETWEVSSSSADDAFGGIGSHSITQNYLDDDYIQRSVTVNLNGTTWVDLNSDMFRPDGAVALPSGSSNMNIGKITVRDKATMQERQIIPVVSLSLGASTSLDTHYTVPAGKTAYIRKYTPFFAKDDDGNAGSSVMLFGTNTWVSPGTLPFYQNAFDVVFSVLFALPEKTDLRYRVNSSNAGPITFNQILEIQVVDN